MRMAHFEHLVSGWWSHLGRIRRCGFVERGVSLGAGLGLGFQKSMAFTVSSL